MGATGATGDAGPSNGIAYVKLREADVFASSGNFILSVPPGGKVNLGTYTCVGDAFNCLPLASSAVQVNRFGVYKITMDVPVISSQDSNTSSLPGTIGIAINNFPASESIVSIPAVPISSLIPGGAFVAIYHSVVLQLNPGDQIDLVNSSFYSSLQIGSAGIQDLNVVVASLIVEKMQ